MSTENQTQNSPDFFDLVQPNEQSVAANLRIIENVQAALKPKRVRKPTLPPFIMSSDFKTRLKALKNASQNKDVQLIIDKFLTTKKIEGSYNYIGLSNADYSKISYLDKDRVLKNQDKEFGKITLNIKDEILFLNNNLMLRVRDEDYKPFEINRYVYNAIDKEAPIEIDNCLNILSNTTGLTLRKQHYKTKYNLKIDLKTIWNKSKFDDEESLIAHFRSENINENNIFTIENVCNSLIKGSISFNDFRRIMSDNYIFKFKGRLYVRASLFQIKNVSGYKKNENRDTIGIFSYVKSSWRRCYINIVNNRLISSNGEDILIPITVVKESKLWDSDIRYHTSVGKMIRKLFPNTYSDRQIATFSEEYSKLIVINTSNNYLEVSGEDIRTNYHENNCYNTGTLGNSCMRYGSTQGYLDIYTKFNFCKLALLRNKSGKNIARALLWEIDGKIYRDRIYYANNEALYEMENIFNSQGYINCYNENLSLKIPLALEDFHSISNFPYMDTFFIYYPKEEFLTCNHSTIPRNEGYYAMRNTGGYYTRENMPDDVTDVCAYCDDEQAFDDLYQISSRSYTYAGEYVCSNCSHYVEIEDRYYLDSECSMSAFVTTDGTESDYMPPYRTFTTFDGNNWSLELYNDTIYYNIPVEEQTETLFFKDYHPYVEIEGDYYHPDYLPETTETIETTENKVKETINELIENSTKHSNETTNEEWHTPLPF